MNLVYFFGASRYQTLDGAVFHTCSSAEITAVWLAVSVITYNISLPHRCW